jgi:folate-binding Fe-S cluster repair protein YgfZ
VGGGRDEFLWACNFLDRRHDDFMNDHFSGRALTGWVDLSGRAKFRLTGPDRVRYLNGQVTNNVARLKTGETLPALVCTAKGRLLSTFRYWRDTSSILLTVSRVLAQPLAKRLSMYVMRTKAKVADASDALVLFGLCGEPAATASDPGRPAAGGNGPA